MDDMERALFFSLLLPKSFFFLKKKTTEKEKEKKVSIYQNDTSSIDSKI